MNSEFVAEILGSYLELSIIFYAFYLLLDLKKVPKTFIILLYIALGLITIYSNKNFEGLGAFLYIFAILISVKLLSRQAFFKVLTIFVIAMIMMLLLEIMVLPLVAIMPNQDMAPVYILLIVNVVFYIVLNKIQDTAKIIVVRFQESFINFIIINVFIYSFFIKLIWDYDNEIIKSHVFFFVIILSMILAINFFIYREISRMSERNKAYAVQNEMRNTLEQMMSDMRMHQHEYKNHLTTITGIIDTNEPEEAVRLSRQFLNDVYEFEALDTDIFDVDRDIIRAVLFMKRNEAKEKGYDFSYAFNASFLETRILDYELQMLINNLVNNAFEAISDLKDRHVNIEFGYEDETEKHYVLTKNTGSNIDPALFEKFTDKNFSTKSKQPKERGIGLFSIKNIVKKYKGNVEIYLDQSDIVIKASFE